MSDYKYFVRLPEKADRTCELPERYGRVTYTSRKHINIPDQDYFWEVRRMRTYSSTWMWVLQIRDKVWGCPHDVDVMIEWVIEYEFGPEALAAIQDKTQSAFLIWDRRLRKQYES